MQTLSKTIKVIGMIVRHVLPVKPKLVRRPLNELINFSFRHLLFDSAKLNGQCLISSPEDMVKPVDLPEEAFQQNWDWNAANDTAEKCKHRFIVSDMLTRTMDYKRRLELFMKVLVAVTKATNPVAIDSLPSMKIVNPASLI